MNEMKAAGKLTELWDAARAEVDAGMAEFKAACKNQTVDFAAAAEACERLAAGYRVMQRINDLTMQAVLMTEPKGRA